MQIKLPSGHIAIIDPDDLCLINGCRIFAEHRGPVTYARAVFKKGKRIYLHRLILGLKKGETCDHIDGDGLNNSRKNLRKCSQHQNSFNSSKKRKNKKYKGVYYDDRKKTRKWYAQLFVNRKQYFGGYFETEEEAALAYNKMANDHHGTFARLNQVGGVKVSC